MADFNTSRRLHEESCKVLATGVSSGVRLSVSPTLFFERGDGPYYYDVDGNEYVDYSLAWGPLICGSNHPRINAAVGEQLSRSYTLGAQTRLEIDLARKLVDAVPGVEQVIFSNTGSEAIQATVRLARAATGRNKIIKFEGHYHGWMNNVLVSYHPTADQLGHAVATCGGQPEAEFQDTLVCAWNDIDALSQLLEQHHDEIACVLTEPILVNSGSCMPRDGYLAALIDLCRQHGAVSIFDEVITGFRIALGGAREYFGLQPDLSVYAKAMAGGFTVAAVAGKAKSFDVLRDGITFHAGTYNGTAHNLAGAIAALELLSEPGVYERMHRHGYAIREHLEESAHANGLTLITSGVGSAFTMHFGLTQPPADYADTLASDMQTFSAFRGEMLQNGVHLPDNRWYVGITHTDRELERTAQAITQSMAAIA